MRETLIGTETETGAATRTETGIVSLIAAAGTSFQALKARQAATAPAVLLSLLVVGHFSVHASACALGCGWVGL